MSLSQFLIIYFACGLPFSIHYLVKSNRGISYYTIINSLLILLTWFLYAFKVFFKTKFRKNLFPEGKILKLQKQFSDFIRENCQNVNFLQVRQLVQHYVSLTLAKDRPGKESFELLRISGHPKPVIGMKCIQRRNGKKIDYHLKSVRKQFVELISQCSNLEKAIEIAEDLTNALNDKDATLLLRDALQLRESKNLAATEESLKATSVHQ